MIDAILPKVETARQYTLRREIKTGRGVPLNDFIDKHTGFADTLKQLVNDGYQVRLKDTRDAFSRTQAEAAPYITDKNKILDILNNIGYNKNELERNLQNVQLSEKTQRKILARLENDRRGRLQSQFQNDQSGISGIPQEARSAYEPPNTSRYRSISPIPERGRSNSGGGIINSGENSPAFGAGFILPENLPKEPNSLYSLYQETKNPTSPVPTSSGNKLRSFSETINASPNTPLALKQAALNSYNKLANPETLSKAVSRIEKDPITAYNYALSNNNAEANTTGMVLLHYLDKQGETDKAATLLNVKTKHFTEAGQASQVAVMWNSQSPEGLARSAAKMIQDYNETAKSPIPELTKDQYTEIKTRAENIQKMQDPLQRDMAKQQLLKDIGKMAPTPRMKKVIALFRAGLLTGPKTVTKIGTSLGLQTPQELFKQVPATILDILRSKITGSPRTTAMTLRGLGEGAQEGTVAAGRLLKYGYEDPNLTSRFYDFLNRTNFEHPSLQKYTELPGQVHQAVQLPLYGATLKNDLYRQATVEAINQGLRGTERENFIQKFVNNPTPEALNEAKNTADLATYNQRTAIGKLAGSAQRMGGGAGGFVVPFSQKPSSILMNAVNASPLGVPKAIAEYISSGRGTQYGMKQMLEAIGRTVPGTAILGTGAYLMNNGLMNLSRPTDSKTSALWKAENRRPNTIKIGNNWINISALGPVGELLQTGGYVAQGAKTGDVGQTLLSAAYGLGNTAINMPYLAEANAITNALTNPQRDALKTGEQLAGGFIPTISSDVAASMDPLQGRQINNISDALAYRIPGMRQNLLPTVGPLGQSVPNKEQFVNMVDPFKPQPLNQDTVLNELQRLNDAGTNASIYRDKTSSASGGIKVNMTPAEYTRMTTETGGLIKNALQNLFTSRSYQNMSDYNRAKEVNNVVSQINHMWDMQNIGKLSGAKNQIIQEIQKEIQLKKPNPFY